ncbi:IclR family transcriptional regulator [Pollutimonas subterranea]|uniref:IclR family transcriptional regulator n=1 Tax=Pollutimonas subterranea TaxID=2045210 RepID=A0A2N4U6I4_9BURK|nr:IclR family transcriptional regulator [Pollutimonas subterranea]PLC50607.1 IclR family transcriptional regulator [Pollutimonas subterranea]
MPRKAAVKSIADTSAAVGGVAAVDRAISILAAFRNGDSALNLSELATRTRLYKSTVLRLITSLEHGGLIQRLDDGSYILGTEVGRLYGIYSSTFSLDRVVMAVLRELVDKTGESAAYHVIRGDSRLCLYRVDSPHPIRDHIRAGDTLPIDKGSGGRVLIAFDDTLSQQFAQTDKALYKKIRKDGYHASAGDRLAEVAGISAPVFDQEGKLRAALTLTMPAHRYDERHIAPTVEAAIHLGRLIN